MGLQEGCSAEARFPSQQLRGGLLGQATTVADDGWTLMRDACQSIAWSALDMLLILQHVHKGDAVHCGFRDRTFCIGLQSVPRVLSDAEEDVQADAHRGRVQRPASPRLAVSWRM